MPTTIFQFFQFIIITVLMSSCNNYEKASYLTDLQTFKIIQPIEIGSGENSILMAGYFFNPDAIDSVRLHPGIDYSWNAEKFELSFLLSDTMQSLLECKVYSGQNNISLLLTRKSETSEVFANTTISAKSFEKNQLLISTQLKEEDILVFWENFALYKTNVRKIGDDFSIEIPEEATAMIRSQLRIFGMVEGRLVKDFLLPLHYGKPLRNPADIIPSDFHSIVMYVLMVDRFYNGNTSNDVRNTESDLADRANFYGGDLQGVIEKVRTGYFDELGINSLWLSPILKNTKAAFKEYPAPHRRYSAYHGYWPVSLNSIDPRFGSPDDLRELTALLHQKDKKLILDFVSNHMHEEAPLIQTNPEWKTELNLPDGRKNLRLWDEQRLSTWFDEFLPSIDYSRADAIDCVSDSALFWIQEYGIDGFRHDATKHIPNAFWESLSRKINAESIRSGKSIYQIGETFGDRALIGSYVGSDKMDGQFDFNLYWNARNVFASDSIPMTELAASLQASLNYYGNHHLMGNITGNHDLPRFISLAGGSLSLNEEAGPAGWERNIQVGDPIAYRKMASLAAFTFCIPGVPIVYYGDEIGMPGAGDPDNRRPMKFENLTPKEQELKQEFKKLIHLRNSSLNLIYGNCEIIESGPNHLIFSRTYLDKTSYILFNKSNTTTKLSINITDRQNTDFNSLNICPIQKTEQGMEITLEPYSYEILFQP